MKVTILEEKIERNENVTEITLTAEVKSSDPRELPLVEGTISAVGKSVCCPEDEYNELTGTRIARNRAYKAIFLMVREAYKDALKDLNNRLKISQDSVNKYSRAIEAQDIDIKRLIGE